MGPDILTQTREAVGSIHSLSQKKMAVEEHGMFRILAELVDHPGDCIPEEGVEADEVPVVD